MPAVGIDPGHHQHRCLRRSMTGALVLDRSIPTAEALADSRAFVALLRDAGASISSPARRDTASRSRPSRAPPKRTPPRVSLRNGRAGRHRRSAHARPRHARRPSAGGVHARRRAPHIGPGESQGAIRLSACTRSTPSQVVGNLDVPHGVHDATRVILGRHTRRIDLGHVKVGGSEYDFAVAAGSASTPTSSTRRERARRCAGASSPTSPMPSARPEPSGTSRTGSPWTASSPRPRRPRSSSPTSARCCRSSRRASRSSPTTASSTSSSSGPRARCPACLRAGRRCAGGAGRERRRPRLPRPGSRSPGRDRARSARGNGRQRDRQDADRQATIRPRALRVIVAGK